MALGCILRHIRGALRCKHAGVQLHHYDRSSCGKHIILHTPGNYASVWTGENTAIPSIQPRQAGIPVQCLGAAVDRHNWRLHLLPEPDSRRRRVNELVSFAFLPVLSE